MKSRLAVTIVATLSLAPAAVAVAASISHTTTFVNKSGKVQCGVMIHATNKPATQVLCAAKGIPAPKNGGVGDAGFVQLSASGKPGLLRLSQNSFVSGTTATLGKDRLWSQLGVTCHTASVTVICFNGDNHGFIIGDGHYKSF
jgi:hypothetical protein